MGNPEEAAPLSSQPSAIVRYRGENKKFWNIQEEAALIEILAELNDSSWKTSSGYKNGYCHYVEKRMEEKLPGCGFKADRHIATKIKALKRQLLYTLDIEENGKGFWWDDEQKMVVGNKDAFLSWAKNHEKASSLFMKPFMHYDKLCEVYGRKRSKKRVRPFAETTDIEQAVNETQSNSREESTSITQSTISPPVNDNSKKPRGSYFSETEFLELSKTIQSLAEAQKDLAGAMINMNKASSRDVEISEMRKKLFSVMMNLPGFSPLNAVKATRIIGQDDRKVEVFFSIPDEHRVMFALLELESS